MSLKILIIVGVLVGLGVFALYYFNLFPAGWRQGVEAAAGPYVQMITNYFSTNPTAILTLGISLGSVVIIPLIKSYFQQQAEVAKAKAQITVDSMSTQVMSLQQSKTAAETELEKAQAQLKEYEQNDLATAFSSVKTENNKLQQIVESLRTQNTDLMNKLANQPVKIVEVVK